MESRGSVESRSLSDLVMPRGWNDVLVRTVMAMAVAFVVYNMKEFLETRQIDAGQVGVDALWIGGGMLVVNALLRMMRP
jgi:hypothetical protein